MSIEENPETNEETHARLRAYLERENLAPTPPYRKMREVHADLRYIKARYGIRIRMGQLSEADKKAKIVRLKRLDIAQAHQMLGVLREEFAKYPPSYIKDLDIRRFHVVHSMYAKDDDTTEEVEAGGRADKNGRQVIIPTEGNTSRFREVVHHELHHRSDHRQIQRVLDRFPIIGFPFVVGKELRRSREWLHGIPKSAQNYNWDFRTASDDGDSEVTGFAKKYGTMDLSEDQATLAEKLMTNPNHLNNRTRFDKALNIKVRKMIMIFQNRTRGKMNALYFQDLMAGKVDEAYWDKPHEVNTELNKKSTL